MAIDIARYDPAWPEQFRAEAAKLTGLLQPWLATPVEHIGSTSVPGLAAKPILDMMAGVHDLHSATDAIPVLTGHGYTHAPHRPATLWFHKAPDGSAPEQGLHLTEPGSSLWRERLAFRDALRADPALARQYQELKERLAADSGDIAAYTAGKREFVVRVLARAGVIAEQWRQSGRTPTLAHPRPGPEEHGSTGSTGVRLPRSGQRGLGGLESGSEHLPQL
jgi:GrpB-like predicted nucleotidyltransferase (UPF0157 family)